MTETPLAIDAALLFQKSLAARGVTASAWALAEACEHQLSLAAFARCAREQGLEANVLRVADGDLRYLPVGTLVAFEGGALAAIRAHTASGVLLENADGSKLHAGETSAMRPVMALDIQVAALDGRRFLARLASRLRGEPHAGRAIVLSVLLAVVLAALGLAGPVITHAALGSALPDRAESTLGLLAFASALLGMQIAYVGFLRRRALLYLNVKLSEKAALDVFSHLLKLPFAKLREREVGTIQQATSSATAAAEATTSLASQLLDTVLGLAFLVYAFILDPSSGLVAAGAGFLVVIAGLGYGHRRVRQRRELLRRTRDEQQGLYEALVNIETVKCESIEGRMLARWLDRLLEEEGSALALRLQSSSFATITAAFERIVFAAVLLFMARRCLSGGATVADLVAGVQATAGFMSAAQRLAALPPALSDYRSNVERSDEVLAEPAENFGSRRLSDAGAGPALSLRDVWFRYEPDSPWIFTGLDLTVRSGEMVILSWPSGAGKSTLLRLLSGLLPPNRGDVLVHGIEAQQARRMITYIPQQATLFPVSIMENLSILSGGASRERLVRAAEATGLLAIVETWGMGMETIISLGVANLSSGQRQLILFTAAVASTRPIVLLDEALAHVDLSLRARIGGPNLFQGRTVIAVVHDASAREVGGARVVALVAVPP